MPQRLVFCFLTALIGVAAGASAYGQDVGSMVGTVTDPSGAAIAVCQVTVVEIATGLSRTASCEKNGYFVVPSLRPTDYRVTVASEGFSMLTKEPVRLQANQSLTFDAKLSVGGAIQSVSVQAQAETVNTTTPTLSQVVDRNSIIELPLNGRNAASLTALVPGAVKAPDGRATQGLTIPQDVTISVNGSRGNQTSYQLDGALNTDELTNVNAPFPFPDALQEFSVQTSSYSAQYGQNAGAVVNIVTRSGKNEFHGNAFEFLRNAVFNARNYFATSRDQLKRNQFGGTFGGPVILPKYNGHDRTFFFVGYQGTILRDTLQAQSAIVPTIANVGGDFSAMLNASNPANPLHKAVQLVYPGTQTPVPGNIILPSQMDPVFLNLEKFLPQTSGNGQVFYPTPQDSQYKEVVVRIDQKLSGKDQLTGRYYYNGYTLSPPYLPGNFLTIASGRYIPDNNFLVEEDHIFKSNLLNSFRFAVMDINGQNLIPSGIPSDTQLGVKLNYDPQTPPSNTGICVTGFFCPAGSWPTQWARTTYQWGDDLHWVHGKHDIGLGVLVMRNAYDNINQFEQRPAFTFSGDSTGYAPADLAFGAIRELDQASGQFMNVRNTQSGYYLQDLFHVSSRLTLSAGLRYEPFKPWVELAGRVMYFNPTAFAAGTKSHEFVNAPPGLLFPGDAGFPTNGVNPNYDGFAPRVGFAYDATGDGKTSVRGGAGMFYDTNQVMVANIPFITNPFVTSLSLITPAGPLSDPYRGITDPFPGAATSPNAIFPAGTTAATYDPFHSKYQTPVVYEWNLTAERQIFLNSLLGVSYVGFVGSHGLQVGQLNPAVYIPGSALPTNSRRLYPGYGSISSIIHDVSSSYHSLQLSLKRQVTRGFTLTANYTYQKTLDDSPSGVSANSALVPRTLPYYFPNPHSLDNGPADWDRTHVGVISYLWEVPKFGNSHLMEAVLGNWEVSGILTLETGAPFTVYAGKDVSLTNIGEDRAVMVGKPYATTLCAGTTPCKNWLNPASFVLPATGTFGTVSKGALRGPKLLNFDMGLFKNIPINERLKMQFRSEFFNTFNNTAFANPNASVSGGSFGGITSAGDPRIIQFALKLSF
jgi:hypothetical protein